MKNRLKHSFLLLLAFAVLTSSAGVTVFKMVCGKSGKETISFQQFTNCCKKNNKACENFQNKCCDFSSQTFKVSLLQKSDVKPYCFAPLIAVSSYETHKPHFSSNLQTPREFVYTPPNYGRKLLCLKSTFLI